MLHRCNTRFDPAPIKDYKEVHNGFRLSVHTPWLGWRPEGGGRASRQAFATSERGVTQRWSSGFLLAAL